MSWLGLYFCSSQDHEQWPQTQQWIARVAYEYSDQLTWLDQVTLVVEIQKSQKLYATPETLLTHLTETLRPLRQQYRLGTAPNPMAAGLMARLGTRCDNQASLMNVLDHCPIDLTPLPDQAQKSLYRCGIDTLGAFNALPIDQRVRRFGQAINLHIQKLYGQQPTLIEPWHPQDQYYRRIDLIDPITSKQRLQHYLDKACEELKSWLIKRNQALTAVMIRCKYERPGSANQSDLTFELTLAKPSFDQQHLKALITLKIDQLTIERPINGIVIQCESTSQHTPSSNDLFDRNQQQGDWPQLLDHLKARLGERAMTGISPYPHHQPEHAWRWRQPDQVNDLDDAKHRPSWLLPEPVACHRDQLVLKQGPERIETGWWDNNPCQRDYWIAQEPNGRTLWVFHEHKPRMGWFIHGIFG